MKKWMYVIFPGIGLVVFLFFYSVSQKELAERDHQRAEQIARQKADDDARKADIEKKARDDATKHAAEQAAEEARAQADKEAKWQAETDRIKQETDQSNGDVEKYTKMVADDQAELDRLHKEKEQSTRDSFDAAKAAELAMVQRQNAEMDIQRMVGMIANRADQSSMTKMPANVPPTAGG